MAAFLSHYDPFLAGDDAPLHPKAYKSRVYLGGTEEDPVWREIEGLRCSRVRRRDGMRAHTADLVLDYSVALAGEGPGYPAENAEARRMTGPDGKIGSFPAPPGIVPKEHVRVTLVHPETEAEALLFVGHVGVAGQTYDLKTAAWHLPCHGHRARLAAVPVHGTAALRPTLSVLVWIEDSLPVFNENNKPDRMAGELFWLDFTGSGSPPQIMFMTPEWAGVGAAGFWTPGSVLDALRDWHYENPQEGLVDVWRFLEWPRPVDGGHHGFLFRDDAGQEMPVLSMSLPHDLNSAIDKLVKRAGAYSWTLGLNAFDPGSDWSILKIFSLSTGYDAEEFESEPVDIRRGEIAAPLSEENRFDIEPEGRITIAPPLANYIRMAGEKLRAEATITLSPGWDEGTPEADWITEWAADPNSRASRSQKYENVFLRFVVSPVFDWSVVFLPDAWQQKPRAILSRLLSGAVDPASTDEGVSLSIQVWRSTDDVNWDKLDETARIAPGGMGILLGPSARKARAGNAPFSWNGDKDAPVTYSIRATIAVEADQRLFAAEDMRVDDQAGKPIWGALYEAPKHRYDERVNSILPVTGGVPVTDGGTDTLLGTADDPDRVLRTDANALAVMAERTGARVGRTRVSGALPVTGLFAVLIPGVKIGKLLGGGESGGVTRPDFDLNTVVREVEFDIENFRTVLRFGG